MTNLRSKLIRLAYRQPHLRADLMPLLRHAGLGNLPGSKSKSKVPEIDKRFLFLVASYLINTLLTGDVSQSEAEHDLEQIARQYTDNPKFLKVLYDRLEIDGRDIIAAPFRNQSKLAEELVKDAWFLSHYP